MDLRLNISFGFFILISLVIFSHVVVGLSESEAKFIAKYGVDPSLAARLEAHRNQVIKLIESCNEDDCEQRHAVWELPFLPGYLMKRGVTRIEGMERIRLCIEKHNLDRIIVPQKYFYHIPGRPKKLKSTNYFIIVPKLIEKKAHQPLNLQEVRQLCTLVEQTGYSDIQKPNILRLENDQLAMIDTDIWAFNDAPYVGIMRFIAEYGEYDIRKDFTNEALKYILSQLKKHMPTDKDTYRKFYEKLKTPLKKRPDLFEIFSSLFPKPKK